MSCESSVRDQLLKWLECISDSCVDPWPNGGPDPKPVDPNFKMAASLATGKVGCQV